MEFIQDNNGKKREAVYKKCEYCGKDFLVRKAWIDTQKFCSRACSAKSKKKRVTLNCAYCGKEFERIESHLGKSKSGLYFCCRDCKDKGQQLENGLGLRKETGLYAYREAAMRVYDHKCAVCGWNLDDRVLEVHHIDSDRSNNTIENLLVLCPICHKFITLNIYSLEELMARHSGG